jgi:hypothetical protein
LALARIQADGSIHDEALLDERVCDCCPTSALAFEDGRFLIAYRDRSHDEIRDIALVRGSVRDPRTWTSGIRVHADGWRIAGCPVNGPRLARHGEIVALAWFTAADERARVQLAFSLDAGAHFGAPLCIAQEGALGRVDVVLVDAQRALVTWLELDGEGARWCARLADWSGSLGDVQAVATVTGERGDGALRLGWDGDSYLAVWTESSTGRLRLARLRAGMSME